MLSIDVGIKNLSFCLFDTNENKIIDWGIINLSETESHVCHCKKPAKFITLQGDSLCNKHKSNIIDKKFADTEKIKPSDIKKLCIPEIKTKEEWRNYLSTTKEIFSYPISKNASEMDLVTISRNLQTHFDNKLWDKPGIDVVIIENQISPLASRMKTIQGMITQYFVKNVPSIHFVNSCNKLKNVKEKLTYAERKKEGIRQCEELLKCYESWIPFFTSSKKKDDLSDCFLQGLWFIKNRMK